MRKKLENHSRKFSIATSGPRIYLFDKPEGMTTFDVIRRVRPYLTRNGREKIGHFGTLDPFATGLVAVAVGGASRLNNLVHEFLVKNYVARGMLGEKRDTGDVTGQIVESSHLEASVLKMTKEELDKNFQFLVNQDYWQTPPAYSAVKYQGKNLYEYARKGITVHKEPVLRNIYKLEVCSYSSPQIEFLTQVSTGTYIRVLWEDMAQSLGCLGYLNSLRRLSYGTLSVERALPVPKRAEAETFFKENFPGGHVPCLRPYELLAFQRVLSDEKWAKRFRCGNSIPLRDLNIVVKGEFGAQKYCWVFDSEETLIGLGAINRDVVAPKVNFV